MAKITAKIVARGKGTSCTLQVVDVKAEHPDERTVQYCSYSGAAIAYPVAEGFKVGSEIQADVGLDLGEVGDTVVVTSRPLYNQGMDEQRSLPGESA